MAAMPGIRQKPTIYDIAELSGASASTVSSVLSGSWKSRRISDATADRIRQIADEQGYSTNMQARGLRQARSGMVGMILPVHDNRFFAAMSQSFEAHARSRGWCPVVVSTLRDPAEEIRTVETLISYAIDSLFIAGATDPKAVGDLCRAADLPHVYVDLPGFDAPSVVSDNYLGAEILTRTLIGSMKAGTSRSLSRPYFLGGLQSDYASARRMEAFRAVARELCGSVSDDQVIGCSYAPTSARIAVAALLDRLGGMPAALFINSLTVFEGALSHFITLQTDAFETTVVGCYDYDPFAAFLQFPVHMIRQNSGELVARAFDLIESGETGARLIEIEPELIAPRTIYDSPFGGFG